MVVESRKRHQMRHLDVLYRLLRDQEVGGSNPLAPTTSFRANNLQQRKVPTTSWLCAKRSVVQMSSPNDLHFPLQIGVRWRDAATTFSSFCSPRSPNSVSRMRQPIVVC